MEKITKRQVFEALVKMAEDGNMHIEDFDPALTDEAVASMFKTAIESLDKKAAKAKETAAAKKVEGDELTEVIRSLLTDDFQTIAGIAAQIEGDDVSVAKCQYRLVSLAKNGEAEKGEITVAGSDGKNRKVAGYKRV